MVCNCLRARATNVIGSSDADEVLENHQLNDFTGGLRAGYHHPEGDDDIPCAFIGSRSCCVCSISCVAGVMLVVLIGSYFLCWHIDGTDFRRETFAPFNIH